MKGATMMRRRGGDELRPDPLVRGVNGLERRVSDVVNGSGAEFGPGLVCQACGLKFTAGYAFMAHRERDALGRPCGACLPEGLLYPVLGLVCLDVDASPRWYTSEMASARGAARAARLRLVDALRDGSVSLAQLRYIPVDPDCSVSVVEFARMVLEAWNRAVEAAKGPEAPGVPGGPDRGS